jgi:hypothetical protein
LRWTVAFLDLADTGRSRWQQLAREHEQQKNFVKPQ